MGACILNNDLLNYNQKPFLKAINGVILDVNNDFLALTQFTKNELFEKNINEILYKLLRNSNQINITDTEIETILFTKNFDVRFVKVKKFTYPYTNIYIFTEIENSRLDNKLLFIDSLINDNNIGIGIYTANDLRLIKANQKYLDYMPKPFNQKSAIYGKHASEFMYNYEKSNVPEIIKNIIRYNKPKYYTEAPGCLLDHNHYWDNTITPISENGEVKYIMSMLENVTERVLSRKHIHRKKKQLESIIESVEDVISIVDKDGKYIKQNNNMTALLGLNDNRYVGDSTKVGKYYNLSGEPIPISDLCFFKLLNGVKVKGQKLKYVYNNKEYYLCCNAIPIFDDKGQFETGVFVVHNITELVENNKLIKDQKKELEIIFDNMHDAVGIVDKNGNYVKKNKALINSLEKNYCISAINKVGDTLQNTQKYYDCNNKKLTLKDLPAYKVLKGETVKEQRIIIKNKNAKVYLDFNAIPIFDNSGNFQYGIIVAHNVTHLVRKSNKIEHEQQLIIKAEKEKIEAIEKVLSMKDEFISLISHEFKTPLNVIYSAIQLIEYVYIDDVPDKVKDLIKNIKQNTFRQLRLVNNLLDITRLNSGRLKLHIKNIDIVSLTRQISQSVRLYSDQKKIQLLFKCDLECKKIPTDDEKLERIILNLLSNAIKFTNEGGVVTINLHDDKESNMIIIEVSDTGLGIPKDKHKLIFERFGQVDSNLSRQAEGTGIGLSLVKKLVDALNGKIALVSEPGQGSTFKISLPFNQDVDDEKSDSFLDEGCRLVNALNVEFSDIYL